jgi:hypothetical protein
LTENIGILAEAAEGPARGSGGGGIDLESGYSNNCQIILKLYPQIIKTYWNWSIMMKMWNRKGRSQSRRIIESRGRERCMHRDRCSRAYKSRSCRMRSVNNLKIIIDILNIDIKINKLTGEGASIDV